MNEIKVSYLNYPIYGIASNENYVVTSGGGGGKSYGIEDLLDVNIFNEKEKKLDVIWSTTEQKGVIDSILYVQKYNIWIGSLKNECILFKINEETGPSILLNFITDFAEKNPRQVVVKFSENQDFILTGGDDKTLRLWKLKFTKDSSFIHVTNDLYLDSKTAVEHLGDFIGHDESIKDCDITFDENIVCTCSSDYSLKIWDTYRYINLHTEFMKNPKNKNDKLIFRCCKFLKKSNIIREYTYSLLTTASSARGNSFLIIWNIYYDNKKEKFSCVKQNLIWIDETPCCNMAISTNENFLALGFSTGSLKLYNSKYSLLAYYKKHELPITAMCFTKNDKFLLAAGADYSISCVDVNCLSFRFKKIWKFFIFLFISLIIFIILLDCFNVGYDLHVNSPTTDKLKFSKIDIIKQKNQPFDEL
ncbi:ER membrane protein Sec12, putative [Plasmodium gallinaceum]|uniref:ER membrane protein Sec12, putative n=1 Tax=Plasmodium gallinaceum TaxID=5849 RepID=A0A1J1GV95_PLAGA|nr:ER membrane protein Sec12, putative [Plasmodium gallinaceum]CRG96212.1 ER membrane protein Sec12, putative [Plasmodium gallinaceum]